jgi:hypothetical protein
MNDTPLGGFFGVVARSRTWLNLLFHIIAFPLGLFYFIFLVVGLSVGLGLVIVWLGIPILLVVTGAWWLFGAFERLQARALLGADVPDAPRSWEAVEGIWGKVKAHFGSGATWKDLLYLLAKLAFGVVSFTLVVTLASLIAWLFSLPALSQWNVATIDFGNGTAWTPPLWLALLGIPAGILMIFVSLHVLNAWGWVCKRWAELMFRTAPAMASQAAPPPPLVSTSPVPPQPPAQPVPPAPPAAPAASPATVAPTAVAPPRVSPATVSPAAAASAAAFAAAATVGRVPAAALAPPESAPAAPAPAVSPPLEPEPPISEPQPPAPGPDSGAQTSPPPASQQEPAPGTD